ncbi:CooT family nickel-binding protein [Desulfoluna sp.]|uniref:CooT family nickel-binding protein n=1 Tax=Desulfoluna sp. TaxID=2045199 RepID=UPI00262F1336|nr:CooT family nickel-binding protein [Desulfoluna sp.]
MCESNVYLKSGGREELVMENVAAITPSEKGVYILRGLLGDVKEIKGDLADINLMAHRIVFTDVS